MAVLLFPSSDESSVPSLLHNDLVSLFEMVENWRTSTKGQEDLAHYKQIARDNLSFNCECGFASLGRKKLDLCKTYKTEKETYRAVIEIETSTIENCYNDILKMLQLSKASDFDYGVIVFVQNERKGVVRLTESQLRNNLLEGLNLVLDDFKERLFLYHIIPVTTA